MDVQSRLKDASDAWPEWFPRMTTTNTVAPLRHSGAWVGSSTPGDDMHCQGTSSAGGGSVPTHAHRPAHLSPHTPPSLSVSVHCPSTGDSISLGADVPSAGFQRPQLQLLGYGACPPDYVAGG